MILLLAFVVLITFICLGTGFLWYRFQSLTVPLINILFTGLILVTCISQAVNIFIPLDSRFFAIYSGLIAGGLAYQRKSFSALVIRIVHNAKVADKWLFPVGAVLLLLKGHH